MTSLRDHDWHSVYESGPRGASSDLVDRFYRPALERSIRYDRIAGYFDSGGLVEASQGVEAFVRSDGEMRLIVGQELQQWDRPAFEALTDTLQETLEELKQGDDEPLGVRLLAWLLADERLSIRVAVPVRDNWGIFHPKVGIFEDGDGEALSFEGSVNETGGGWTRNFERFKVHRSWVDGQDTYVDADVETFERLWHDDHTYVRVYELPEAIREELIDWKAPRTNRQLESVLEEVDDEPNTLSVADDLHPEHVVARSGDMPGGLHLADQLASIEPWPHQRVVSDTVVSAYPNGFLFSDEVGLGKTIEIGYTLQRLGLTGEVETALLLVPASLQTQWQEELWEKFNLPVYRYERDATRGDHVIDPWGEVHEAPDVEDLELSRAEREQAWTESPIWRFVHARQGGMLPTVVLTSWHRARLDDYHDVVAPSEGGDVRTRDELCGTARGLEPEGREGVWDAVVVDEAHAARRGTKLRELLGRLRDHVHALYLASATPMQLHYEELHSLLSLFDLPGGWSSRGTFTSFFEFREALGGVWDDMPSGEAIDDREAYAERIARATKVGEGLLSQLVDPLDAIDTDEVVHLARQCCELARDYGERFDDYDGLVDEALDAHGLSGIASRGAKDVDRLLRSDEVIGIVSDSDIEETIRHLDLDGWRVLFDVFQHTHPISAYIHRNTRETLRKYQQAGVLDEGVPEREPTTRNIALDGEAERAYELIDDYTKEFYKRAQRADDQRNRALGFVMTTYRQRLTSSVRAIQKSLTKRLDRLRETKRLADRRAADGGRRPSTNLEAYDELEIAGSEDGTIEGGGDVDGYTPADNEEGRTLLEDEIEALEGFISVVENIGEDPKLEQLSDDLRQLEHRGHDRVLIFTQYTDTLEYIRDRIAHVYRRQIATYSGDGAQWWDDEAGKWVGVSKERVKREFADDEGRVEKLLGTEAMSEGLNLQFCGVMINYDLPWNPMKVEQRIGRIDRIGQEHDTIEIINYKYEETVESDIYEALDDRIGMFEDVVGELQPILSDVEETIRQQAIEADRSDAASGDDVVDDIEGDAETSSVDIPEVLAADDDTPDVEGDVRERARLDAWQSYRHPDIDEIGVASEQPAPWDLESWEEACVESERMREIGFEFAPIEAVDRENVDLDADVLDEMYRLQLPDDVDVPPVSEDTLAAVLVEGHSQMVAVTFQPHLINSYPSLRLFTPGDPLFETALERLNASEMPLTAEWMQVAWHAQRRDTSVERGDLGHRIIGAFLADDDSIRLEEGEYHSDVEAEARLVDWGRRFVEDRM